MTKYIDGYVCAFGNQHACFESSLTVSDWASWVQAVGSICAILASAGVVWWQVRRQHRLQVDHAFLERLREERRQLLGSTSVFKDGMEQLAIAARAMRAQGTARALADGGYEQSNLDLSVAALEDVDLSKLSTAGLSLSFRAARKYFNTAIAAVKDGLRYSGGGAGAQPVLNMRADAADAARVSCADYAALLSKRAEMLDAEIERHS